MASFVRLLYHVPDSAQTMQYKLGIDNNARTLNGEAVQAFHASVSDGAQASFTKVATGLVQASATITVTSTGPTNTQTGTVLGRTITAVTSGAVPASGQFNINASPTVVATGIALAINSLSTLSGIVTATSALGVVTVTAVEPGVLGNGYQLANVNLSNTTFSGSGFMAGGSDGKQVSTNNGLPS